ncbi:unnamed protein product [Sphagnum balticum]
MAAVPGMFDVFLNHRGPDVKQNFAAHLHQALQEAGCRPFLDMQSLEKGQHGQKKIYEALRCASVHVAVFSKHYADSNYCLDELCAMLESKKLIIAVFYDVSPSVLRCDDPDGPYTKALNIHGRRSVWEVKKWKDALHMAAELNGFKLDDYNGDEAELKTAIVSKVRDHLRASQLPPVAPYQVGLKETSKELIETLNRMEKVVGILSLVGMGGIGKTTLAEEIYRCFQKNDTFEKKSILMNVRESAILDLQKQLARDLFKKDVRSRGEFNECCNRGMDRKVLIVIDDIDQKGQFDELIPNINKLCPGSRVIITSRDSNVVNNIMNNGNCEYLRHEMALLSTTDSTHLFNWHAFQSTDAIDGFQELAKNVADACCGLPLALEIIGCFLFDKREERSASEVKKWKEALRTAADLNGFKLDDYNGDEAQLKTAIVSRVWDHLRASQLPPVAPYQVGLEETSKELIEILNRMEKDVGILSLVGMGGIGKTTLAKEIYCYFQKNDTFEKKSFLMDVRESAILDLQKQLARDLFKKDVKGMEEFNRCFNRVMDHKVLIVIDDVDQKCQFDQLIPDIKKLCPGSRVIITSRDSNVVNNIMEKNENCKYLRHEMALLSTTDSRHLFNWHAFHSTDAIGRFQELAKNVADACCGLPLALEVTGCFLFDKREECDFNSTWPQTIKTLIKEQDILKKLKVSYDGLSPEARMMFLDIACFMVGQPEHIAMQIFEACKFDYDGGQARFFSSLKDKCLVKLDEDRQIIMHDLLRDMGRQVVKNESHNMEKRTPSHLWNPEMVQRVLQNKEGTNQVRGLSTFGIGCGGIDATNVAENYIGVSRLHFLLLDGDNVKGDFSTWSRELSWLQWMDSNLSALPLELDLQMLAVLDLTSNKKLMQIWPNDLEV